MSNIQKSRIHNYVGISNRLLSHWDLSTSDINNLEGDIQIYIYLSITAFFDYTWLGV